MGAGVCVICRIKKRDFIKWESLSIFMGPREGASREDKTEDREVTGANKKNKIPEGMEGNGTKTRGETASEKGKATQRDVPLQQINA